MNEDMRIIFNNLLAASDFINSLKVLKQMRQSFLFGEKIRPLTEQEIELLKNQGNRALDWTKIRVAEDFKTDFIHNNSFFGECVLGVFAGALKQLDADSSLPDGIYNSTLADCEIGSRCLIKDNGLISRYLIKDNVIVADCGSLTAAKGCTYGNGMEMVLGIETGGREVVSFADLDIITAGRVATRQHDQNLQKAYRDFVGEYIDSVRFDYGIVQSGTVVRDTRCIKDSYIGEHALIHGAALIRNCTILSNTDEQTEISHGAFVENSCVQWGCEVTSMAIVADSVLTEHSHVERHAKVTSSIIGPNTGIAEGEVTCCLVGPFVGFHHQALLIAAIWPEGKGNVAYGANVGSNHTSRAPDQEIFCGEGVFFGLGTNIKFPSDFSGAPYSIIATGVSTSPQKIEFPFSLIHSPSLKYTEIPSHFNEIIPAWVLSDNIYTIMRNEGKYKKRNKARRSSFEFAVFRPDIMDKVLKARDRLCNVKTEKAVYSEKDIPGLGKNFMQEKKRREAIAAYNFYIEYYCLSGLRDRIEELLSAGQKDRIAALYSKKTDNTLWEHQRGLINNEKYSQRSIPENLERLIVLLQKIARDTYKAKEKDDIRGEKIIRDYKATYTQAADDGFIVAAKQETEKTVTRIKELIARLAAV
ncbi:MAG: DUF4954 family protein [Spirochaetales bacterium]|nr:DUF4954 family protein [Spirochaetales bacterium]